MTLTVHRVSAFPCILKTWSAYDASHDSNRFTFWTMCGTYFEVDRPWADREDVIRTDVPLCVVCLAESLKGKDE